MNEHLDGHTPDDAEGAQHVEGRRGGEAEDGLAFVEHNEGLGGERESESEGQTDRWTGGTRKRERSYTQTFLSL